MATSQSSEKTTLRGKKKGSNPIDSKRKSASSVDPMLAQYKNKLKIKDQEFSKARKELQQRGAEIEVINSVQEGLASKLDMQGIYELIGKKVRDLFHVEVMDIVNYDPETGLISMPYSYEKGDRSVIEARKPYGFRQQVIKSGKPLLINRDFESLAIRYDNPLLTGTWPKSALFVPLVVDGKVKSIISIQDLDHEDAYSASDVLLLQTLAHSMGIALENAWLFTETQRLFDETKKRNAELQIINSIQQGLASQLEFQSIIELIGEKLCLIFKAQTTFIALYDSATGQITFPYYIEHGKRYEESPLQFGQGLTSHVIRGQKPLLISRDFEETATVLGAMDAGSGTACMSWLGVPIIIAENVIGIISLQSRDEDAFSSADLSLLSTVASSMGIALQNAQLWEKEKLYRKALQRELDIGREIQAGFLPEALPQAAGWEIEATLMSAREVAGDFYDAFELPNGNIGLVIADVCDKGVGAALFMTLFRSLIRVLANQEYFEKIEDPVQGHSIQERLKHTISLTNNYIAETHEKSGMFATLFFGILDLDDGTLTYINGGHEPPLILRSGKVNEVLYKTGHAVGIAMNSNFEIRQTQLLPGDIFFAFTDGVPDCMNPNGAFFGRQHMQDIIQCNNHSAHNLIELLKSELGRHIGNADQFDDITLLAVRRSSPNSTTFAELR